MLELHEANIEATFIKQKKKMVVGPTHERMDRLLLKVCGCILAQIMRV